VKTISIHHINTQEKITMKTLMNAIQKLFGQKYHSDLEQYIAGKNPTNAADVDYWQRQYEHKTYTQSWGQR